ncbi:unnamed protein product, partial [Mesorhabditis belari]|uniref:Potassium channel domain-containing protein n=1 Tax=Mesorhabditis belari TaxID=2138241 RepID=A0AAF3EUW9_9BILA
MNAASIAYLRDRDRSRRSSISENSFQSAFLRGITSTNGSGNRTPKPSKLGIFTLYLQWIYEKSRLHYLVPIILLTGYSVLGGYIFYTIEHPNEVILIQEKSNFIEREKDELFSIVTHIREHLAVLNASYGYNTRKYNIHKRSYRHWAMNRLRTNVYWYTLSMYYLTEHEAHKALALRPRNPETLWKEYFSNNYGRIHALRNYTEQLAKRCWELGEESFLNATQENVDEKLKNFVNNATQRFEVLTGLQHVLSPVWTFWNAMFLAVTTYTTIGYGNITAKTRLGRLAAMVYAVIGIPLMLMILHKLGRICLNCLDKFWDYCLRAFDFIFCTGYSFRQKNSDQDRITEMPLILAIGVAFGYMFFCAGIFLYFEEDWDYFKSFYFFFCSLTTIGYGDVTPTKSEDMFTIFVFILIGLSLVSMCINVIQLKLEKLFEEILLMLMEEYSADPEARPLRGERISMMDMWRVWRRRKERMQKEEKEGRGRAKFDLSKATNAATAARDAASKAGENLARVFPFMRRRERQVIIEQISHRLRQKHKATQTDIPWYLAPVFEEPYTETSSLSSPPTPRRPSPPPWSRLSRSPARAQPEVLSVLTSLQPTPSREGSPLPASSNGSSNELSAISRSISNSVLSEPMPGSSVGPGGVIFPPNFDPNRRWTFVETGKAPRGAPRGLIVPPTFHSSQPHVQQPSEVQRLIAELDARLRSARAILTPSPYTSSSNSFL